MSEQIQVTDEEVDRLYKKLSREAGAGGYHLNPDVEHTKILVHGILVNQKRYGYWNCPCRLSSGNKQEDLDIICPCDYRDPDLNDYGTCYCALYVSQAVLEGKQELRSIPERRPALEQRQKAAARSMVPGRSSLTYPVWRCKVCGYLCARDEPPEVCPVCRAKKDRFELFM